MIFWDSLAASIFAVVPAWLVLRALRRYRAVNWTRRRDVLLVRSALALLLLSLAVIVIVGVVAIVEEHLGATNTVEKLLPALWKSAIVNCCICILSLLIAWRVPRGTEDTVLARRSVLIAGIYLAVVWLLIITNPH